MFNFKDVKMSINGQEVKDFDVSFINPLEGNTRVEVYSPKQISEEVKMKVTYNKKAFRELLDWLQIIKVMTVIEMSLAK